MNARNNNPAHSHRPRARAVREDGYILLVLILFSALIVIGLMRVIPKALVEGQREREEEVIFRGQEYQRAIQAYVRRFGRYPNSLEELENTNRIRFLRRRYRDPLTKEGQWRFIHIGPGGTFPDAKTSMALPSQPTVNLGLPLSPEMQKSSGAAQPPSVPAGGPAGFPGMMPFGTTPTTAPSPFQPGLSPAGGANPGLPPAFSPSANPTANPAQQPRAAATAQQQQQNPVLGTIGGGAIAGVASLNTGEGIKVWKGYKKYEEWEFIYDFRQDPFGLAAVTRVSGVAAQPGLGAVPGQPAPVPTTPQPATTPSFGPTPFPGSQQPFPGSPYPASQPPYPGPQPGQFPGSQAPGVRPYPQFPPSPVPPNPGRR